MSDPIILRRADFESIEAMLAVGLAAPTVLYAIPASDLDAVLSALRPVDDVCFAPESEAALAHRLARMAIAADADLDPLTGLYNGAWFHERLAEWPPDDADPRPVRSIVMTDLDRFKSINDVHGHVVGDAVLKDVGGRIARLLPPGAVAARIGGEELAILIHAGHDEALALANAVHRAIGERPYTEDAVSVTASIAAATAGAAVDGQALLLRCEEAMYAAKADGRDQVRHASDVRRDAMEQHIDPDVQGFENLTRVIADRVADVLARRGRKLFERIQEQADSDSLTGLYSRRYLDRRLGFEVGEGRTAAPMCGALLDIDYFGQVNKEHGWPTGDAVLAGVAARMIDGIRDTDWAARYGGEEFLIVLHGTELDEASSVIERIREQVAAKPFTGPAGAQVAVTLSAGVAQLGPDEGVEAFKERLSDALLSAKHGGRNRVEVA